MDNAKPLTVDKCKHRNNCYSYKKGTCQGCNIWNYLYDEKAMIDWCRKQNKDISMFTLEMHRELEGAE